MRIVTMADTHLYQAELPALPPGDIFIHVGDLLRRGTLEELRLVVPWLQSLQYPYKILVAGNHDRCFEEERDRAVALLGPQITYLQDSEIAIGGIRFWGSPWQPAFNSWGFNLSRGQALAAKWRLIPDHTDVLLTHCPPYGIGDRTALLERKGCADLLLAVQRVRPLLHIFGHIHQDGGFWQQDGTCFANVTTSECEHGPTIIELDLQARQVQVVTGN